MEIELSTPSPASLETIVTVLSSWKNGNSSNPIHPDYLGWFQRFGADKTASSIRVWSSTADGTILDIGMLDGDNLVRATMSTSALDDEALAHAMAADITDPARAVLPAGNVYLDIPPDALVWERIAALDGWSEGEEWTWLRMDLRRTCSQTVEILPSVWKR